MALSSVLFSIPVDIPECLLNIADAEEDCSAVCWGVDCPLLVLQYLLILSDMLVSVLNNGATQATEAWWWAREGVEGWHSYQRPTQAWFSGGIL